MRTTRQQSFRTGKTGFTLIEMIGVIAIMSILAATIAPNALRVIERTAVQAEVDTLRTLGEQAKLYLRDSGVLPTTANWSSNAELAPYVALSSTDLLYNRRQNQNGPIRRVFVTDPLAPAWQPRAMFLSSMRAGIALPSAAAIAASFQTIWTTNERTVPAAPGWTAWNADNIEYLVIERVNFTSIPVLTFELRNQGATPVSYTTVGLNGAAIAASTGTVPAKAGTVDGSASPKCRPNQRLNLYNTAGVLNYSYVASSAGKTFVFDGANWIPQP